MKPLFRLLAFAALILLPACDNDTAAAKPLARELTREAIGYYCNMTVADHQGPKAQIFLEGRDEPIWFSSVRDAVAFTLLPEEPKSIAAIFVNDMAQASWSSPEPGTWIEADTAYYVVGSDRRGGMGASEAIPFADRDAAEALAKDHGGQVVGYEDIPADYILGGTVDSAQDHGKAAQEATSHATH